MREIGNICTQRTSLIYRDEMLCVQVLPVTDDKAEWVHALKKHRQVKCPTEGICLLPTDSLLDSARVSIGQDSANFKILFKANRVNGCKLCTTLV